jgi:predicted MPP superfamily phosphohydrolase
MSRRRFLGLSATAACAGVGLYTWRWEPHWVEVVRRPLALARLPESWRGRCLVQLSDLHIGPRVDDAYLLRTFERVNDLAPVVVVYSGDFTSYHGDVFAHASRMFPRLPQGSVGTVAILGNHDYGPNWAHPEVADRLAAIAGQAGVRILRNEVADLEGLQIAGLDDLWARRFQPEKALSVIDRNSAALVLSHNPDTVDLPVWGDYAGWILAGHTHGGQCKPPFLPPPLVPVRNRRYTAGEFQLPNNRQLYVNRGLGHLIRARFNVRPEITLFELMPI